MHHVCIRAIWDPDKAKANLEKHGVRFSDAELVLYDPYAVTVEDSAAQGEQRHISIGLDAVGRILVVVYTYRGENVRLISARPATRRERQQYEEGIRF
jgi:uncharacterized protein